MPNLLKNLQLEELSLVDRPANAQAMVSLFKRDNSNEVTMEETQDVDKMSEDMGAKLKPYMDKGMTEEEAMKAYEADNMMKSDEAAEEAVTDDEVATLKAHIERLEKALADNGFVVGDEAIEKRQEEETIEVGGELVVKSLIPAPVLKALETAAIEKADIELTKKAGSALPHFDIAIAKSLVNKFADDEEVMQALKAADKAFSAHMEEFGKSDVDGEFATASEKLDAMVKAYMADKNMKKSEYALAYAALAKTDEGKALITKSYKRE